MKRRFVAAFVTISVLLSLRAAAQSMTTQQVATGLARPVFVTHAPGDFNRVFIVEQRTGSTGQIRILNIPGNTLNGTPYLQILPVATGNEEGLLGLALHPAFLQNGYFWVYYTNSSGNNVVVRYQANTPYATSTTANAASATPVLTLNHPTNSNHNGGWIAFAPGDTEGYLHIATGDGGSANDPPGNAQNINALLGKMLRIDVDGADNVPGNADDDGFPGDATKLYSIPPSNPFAAAAGADEIWAYGLRNPWRDSFDRDTGDLWIGDVGQNQWEEIDYQPASSAGGENYGWRCMEGNTCTGLTGCTCEIGCAGGPLTCPIYSFNHATDGSSCSVTGGYVYRGCAIAGLSGAYFFADYCSNHIKSFRYSTGGGIVDFVDRTTQLDPPGAAVIDTITSFGEDALGEIYICDQGGQVYKIVPPSISDCNANSRADECDIAAGTSADCNADGVPDECQTNPACDTNCDGSVNPFDIQSFLALLDPSPPAPCAPCAGDANGDGTTNPFDINAFLACLSG